LPVPIWIPNTVRAYALHPDGKRFAVFPVPEPLPEEKGNAHVTMLLNFIEKSWISCARSRLELVEGSVYLVGSAKG
jgi:hypothetical protein